MSTSAIPPLPPGYTLDQGSSVPPLPPGYKLDTAAPAPTAAKTFSDYASDFGKHLSTGLQNAAAPFVQSSAPNVALQIWRHIHGQPNTLKDVPEAAVQSFLMAGGFEGGAASETAGAKAPEATAATKSADVLEHPAIKPWVKAAKKEIMKIPGMDLAKTGFESVQGLMKGTPEPPTAPAPPPVPQTNGIPWGSGGQGPLEMRGKMIPPEVQVQAAAETTSRPLPEVKEPLKGIPPIKASDFAIDRTPAQTYYHGTASSNLDSVLQNGIESKRNGAVYGISKNQPNSVFLTQDRDLAGAHAFHAGDIYKDNPGVIVETSLPSELSKKLTTDPVGDKVLQGNIPPKYIKAYHTMNNDGSWTRHEVNTSDLAIDRTKSIIDKAVPPTNKAANLRAHAEVEFNLKKGNVAAAEKALDTAAKKVNPDWPPPDPEFRGTTDDIRKVPGPQYFERRTRADVLEDKGIQEQVRDWHTNQGRMAESDARKEFIARNSTGVTKGELTGAQPKPVKYTKTPAVSSPSLGTAGDADLEDLLNQSLAAVKKAKASR